MVHMIGKRLFARLHHMQHAANAGRADLAGEGANLGFKALAVACVAEGNVGEANDWFHDAALLSKLIPMRFFATASALDSGFRVAAPE